MTRYTQSSKPAKGRPACGRDDSTAGPAGWEEPAGIVMR
jgi:hypothetical protein